MASTDQHHWEFKARFRARAFGWKSQPAITRVKEAVAEIKKVAKTAPVIAAEGAVVFLERVSPALEQVDGSSGSIGTAVGNAIAALVPIIANAPADAKTRERWLDRLFEAQAADEIPYIERLADFWGELCGSKALASAWADRLMAPTRSSLHPDEGPRAYFHGTSACLSALFHAERYDELLDLLNAERLIWPYQVWGARALAAAGRKDEAVRYAESCRSRGDGGHDIDRVCEAILLSAGRVDEAYTRYGLRANAAATYLGTYRAVTKKYPHKAPGAVLADLVASAPGNEGKWFAAAKDAGLYEEALALASHVSCDPRTLARAARDFGETQPAFATAVGLHALQGLVLGLGYEITSADVLEAYRATMAAAERHGVAGDVHTRIRTIVRAERVDGFVAKVLARELQG